MESPKFSENGLEMITSQKLGARAVSAKFTAGDMSFESFWKESTTISRTIRSTVAGVLGR